MLDIKTINLDSEISQRPELLGVSNMAFLPTTMPEHMLYSLETTDGKKTVVDVGGIPIGGPEVVLIAGPCSLENSQLIIECAMEAKAAGAQGLRGGAFKPRTSPYSFQGNGELALKTQRMVADKLGMFVVSEATGEKNLPLIAEFSDIIQIGARNSQNFELLVAAGLEAKKRNKAVLYKRGTGMTTAEWLNGAEYILATGCSKVILCEARIGQGNLEIHELRNMTHLPVISDPTHSVKKACDVPQLALKSIASDTDGLIIEIHPEPQSALSDGPRALLPNQLVELSRSIHEHLPTGRMFNNHLF